MQNLIKPWNADVFLVLSPAVGGGTEEADLSPTVIEHIVQHMDPISLVVARDHELPHVLSSSRLPTLSAAERQRLLECMHSQKLPLHPVDRPSPDWRSYFQVGACNPQLSLALRHRVCLSLIEHAEAERGNERGNERGEEGAAAAASALRYEWVVRARPDIAIPCRVPPAILNPRAVLYSIDVIAFMPRRAADSVLREVPLARQWNVTDCFTYVGENAMGTCNIAVAKHAGWDVSFLDAEVWVPEMRAFQRFEAFYPARSPEGSGNVLYSYGEVPQLPPYPPFGNVSHLDNPCVPTGSLFPSCDLALNKTAALSMQESMHRSAAVPFLT